jgi:hypothetical protein
MLFGLLLMLYILHLNCTLVSHSYEEQGSSTITQRMEDLVILRREVFTESLIYS